MTEFLIKKKGKDDRFIVGILTRQPFCDPGQKPFLIILYNLKSKHIKMFQSL